MSFIKQGATRLQRYLQVKGRIFARKNGTASNSVDLAQIQPVFQQTAPVWARYAWPIVIANALLMGSAVDITWRHWATLVKDLEEIAEKNKQEASKQESSVKSAAKDEDGKTKPEPKLHWERRPTWQRGMFCGIYVAGWCFSTLYLLKYRQTFVTSMKLFRGPSIPIPKQSIPAPSEAGTPESISKAKLQRMVHLRTAGNNKGVQLPLSELIVQDGRNETELVIRQKSSRNYWYVSLTDSLVNGQRFSTETGRDRLLAAWEGTAVQEQKPYKPLGGGWKSGPVTR